MSESNSNGYHARSENFTRIFNRGVREAQEHSRRMGVPNVYSILGHLYYEQPDGTLGLNDPWEGRDTPPPGWAEKLAEGAARRAESSGAGS
ncbi:hypothetical protein Pla175_39530 [Pirellulimonas nuda]|uniref:Uncharacterized protein n=1 Tax=Pirellulimonas nuda TaxID=2528009 RepID=A0A518DGE9_9BACT|nr:hypothetical protein [Pirellulimonas nuda]QDU90546.1 hypothetical protein Pla175_39530 [Pirellulimonas nuda]